MCKKTIPDLTKLNYRSTISKKKIRMAFLYVSDLLFFKINESNIFRKGLLACQVFVKFTVILLIFPACTDTKKSDINKILHAQELIYLNPDSSNLLLMQIQNPDELSIFYQSVRNMLITHAKYRCAEDIQIDDHILNTYHYFHKNSHLKEEGICCYLIGNILETSVSPDSTIIWLKKAETCLNQTDEILTRALNLYSIGHLYLMQENVEIAQNYIFQALNILRYSNNKYYLSYLYSLLANSYSLQNNPFLALQYIDSALLFADIKIDSNYYYYIQKKKGEIFLNKNIDSAKIVFLNLLKRDPDNLKIRNYLSNIYISKEKFDSAEYFLLAQNIAISREDSLNRCILLSKFYKTTHRPKMALLQLERAYNLRQNIFEQKIKLKTRESDSKYDHLILEKQILTQKVKRAKLVNIFLSITLITSIIILTLIYRIKKKRRLIQKSEEEKRKLIKANIDIKTDLDSNKFENSRKKQLLQSKLKNYIHTEIRLRKELLRIPNKTSNLESKNSNNNNRLRSELNLDGLLFEIDLIFENRIKALTIEYPKLTNQDLYLIVFTLLEFDTSDCCILLNIQSDTIYKRRAKIKERLNLDDTTKLEDFLKNKIV